MLNKGSLYVVSAPSGAGKTSLVKALVKETKDVCLSISYTTRAIRPGEEKGIDYNFVTQDEFKKMQAQRIFLECAEVFGNFYGTSRVWVEEARQRGLDVILEIDWQGAKQVQLEFPEAHSIFILPLSRDILFARLQQRHQDNLKIIEDRMKEAKEQISHYNEYHYIIINDHFHEAVEDLKSVIRGNRLRLQRQQAVWRGVIEKLLS